MTITRLTKILKTNETQLRNEIVFRVQNDMIINIDFLKNCSVGFNHIKSYYN